MSHACHTLIQASWKSLAPEGLQRWGVCGGCCQVGGGQPDRTGVTWSRNAAAYNPGQRQ